MALFDPEKITYFAKTDARGALIPFGIKAKDRQRHMYVVGKTGMGKSTLLENMAAQDIMNGEGMAFIDPHGSAAEVLLEYIPEHRLNDVVYFAPFDMEHPVAFNVMEDVGEDKRHLVVSGLMSTFKKIWVDAWSARMEYILTNALLALIEYPDTTLLSVNRLFADKAYRAKVVDYIKDPAVKSFWVDEFASYTDRYIAESVPSIQNKIGQFTGNPLIRNIIGQPHSSFDIRKMMDEKKILIMNLSKGLIGETNANLLGSMLTTRIYLAAMSRADLHPSVMKTMPNFYFYVDEFQSFANSTFANILSEARKYHLNLIIAHQYIAQMEEEVRDAVFGNVGTTVTFRVGPFDAEVLETVFTPSFLAADLVNLGFAQIYLTLMIDGVGSQPFSAITLPPLQRPPVTYRDMAIETSRKQFANKRVDVEKIVADLHAPVPKEGGDKKPFNKPPGGNGGGGYGNNKGNGNGGYGNNNRDASSAGNKEGNGGGNNNQSTQKSPHQNPQPHAQTPSNSNPAPRPVEPESKRPAPKPVAPAKQPEDLRAILSRLSQEQSTSDKTAPKEEKKDTREVSPAKNDLKNALSAVLKQEVVQPVKESPVAKEVPKEKVASPQTNLAPSTPVVTPAPQEPIAPPRRATPSFTPASVKEGLDPTIIKRMLRDERQDRSPFS
jgi:Type IV secretion-system coupling protein DNA-binding domain